MGTPVQAKKKWQDGIKSSVLTFLARTLIIPGLTGARTSGDGLGGMPSDVRHLMGLDRADKQWRLPRRFGHHPPQGRGEGQKKSSFEGRFAQTQPEWPPSAPADLDLDTIAGLIMGMSPISPLLGIEQERRFHSQMAWISVVDEVTSGWLWLHEVARTPRGGSGRWVTSCAESQRSSFLAAT